MIYRSINNNKSTKEFKVKFLVHENSNSDNSNSDNSSSWKKIQKAITQKVMYICL